MSEKTAAIGFISKRCESEAAGAQAAPTEPRHKEGSSTDRERGQGARASTAAATPPFGFLAPARPLPWPWQWERGRLGGNQPPRRRRPLGLARFSSLPTARSHISKPH